MPGLVAGLCVSDTQAALIISILEIVSDTSLLSLGSRIRYDDALKPTNDSKA